MDWPDGDPVRLLGDHEKYKIENILDEAECDDLDFQPKKQKSTDDSLEKLEHFFKEVADLTFNHRVLADTAVVYPSALGEALSRVDPHWVQNTDVAGTRPVLEQAARPPQCLKIGTELSRIGQEVGGMDDLDTSDF